MFRLDTAWNHGAFGHVALPQHDCPAGAVQFSVTVGWLHEEHGMQTCHRICDIQPFRCASCPICSSNLMGYALSGSLIHGAVD